MGHTADIDLSASAELQEVSGRYSKRELKKITRMLRTGTIGPTVVYYAGLIAPAIAAGVATLCAATFTQLSWSDYWVFMVSGIISAMAGISWYLIFMRLSYRHSFGRSSEITEETRIETDATGLLIHRNSVHKRISWDGVQGIKAQKKFIHIHLQHCDDCVIPLSWFDSQDAMQAFSENLTALRNASQHAGAQSP